MENSSQIIKYKKYNATKHGILSKQMIIKGESKKEFEEFSCGLIESLTPETNMEKLLVEKVIADSWRLKRALRIEKEMIEEQMDDEGLRGKRSAGTVFSCDLANYDTYGKLVRYISSIERGMYRALHELQRLQAERKGQHVPLPVMLDIEAGQD